MPDFFIFRLLLTLLVYSLLYNYSVSIIILIIILITLDEADAIYFRIINKQFYIKSNIYYHKYDKLNDSLSYILLLPLVYKMLSFKMFTIILFTTLFRLFGVMHYYKYNNKKIFILMPDLFKELLLVEYLTNNHNINKNYITAGAIFTKMMFEYWLHFIKNSN